MAAPPNLVLNVLSHHPNGIVGGVTASLSLLSEEDGVDCTWHHTATGSPPPLSAGAWIFNGAFSLDVGWGLDLLESRNANDLVSFVYWHECGVGLWRLLGRPILGEPHNARRMARAERLLAAVRDPRVSHLAASGSTQVALTAGIGIDPQDVTIVYEAVRLGGGRERRRPDDRLHVCCAGTDDPRKNTEAFVELATRYPTVAGRSTIWTWYGDNPQVGAASAVESPGIVHPLQPALKAAEDVYLCLSFDEPLSIAALEALAAGIPVVCLAGTGLAEVLPYDWVACDGEEAVRIVEGWLDGQWPSEAYCRTVGSRFSASSLGRRIEKAIYEGVR